ncbi:MAG TPA: DMT family transporter [Candidatus Binatia bacterium]|nr:DMT family transporter [Candidatus Binatia bacterium]
MTIYLALLAAFCFAVSHILIRRGLVHSNALTASVISLAISAIVAWGLAAIFVPLSALWTPAVWYFVVGGIFAPGLGRTLNFVGIERIGVARAVPIVNSSPIFASIFAVFFLGEIWPFQNILGTCLVIFGVVILSSVKSVEGEWRKMDVIYPVLGAICFGISSTLRKAGLLVDNIPLLAAAITATTGLVFSVGLLTARGGSRIFRAPRSSLGWQFAAGIFNTAAMLLVFYALSFGQVVIVEPLVAANPVLSMLLTAVFLKDLEAVSARIVIGAVCTVAGTLLVVTI